MINFNGINFENINLFKVSRDKHKKEFLDLTYDISSECVLDKDLIPVLNPITFELEHYNEILNKTISSLSRDGLWVNKIIIKNTGNVPIKYENFYENDKLGFSNCKSIIAIQINSRTTKKYINADLEVNDDFVRIKFDTIEVGDFIEINIISCHGMSYIKLSGKTQNFDIPRKKDKYEESYNKQIKILNTFIILLFLICVSSFLLSKYLKFQNANLLIRNPFVIQEVQNAK